MIILWEEKMCRTKNTTKFRPKARNPWDENTVEYVVGHEWCTLQRTETW